MKRNSVEITVIYLFVGIAWISFSDSLTPPKVFGDTATFQSVKGIAYVLFTGTLLFLYLRRTERNNIKSAQQTEAENRKHAAELAEYNRRITEMLESVRDGFMALDEDWNITYWNKEAEAILGIPRDSVIGHNLWQRFPNMESFNFSRYYLRAATERKSYKFKEYIAERKMWLEISLYPSGNGLSIFFHDITQLKQVNAERKKRMAELAATNAELEQFAYIASHDLQEPLRMVTSFLSQLEKKYHDKFDDKARQYIFFAIDGAVRMRRIILDLLEYSRIGKEAFELEKIDVNSLLDEIIQLHATLFEEQKVELVVEPMPVISGARTMIQQLFQNLIINAIRYKQEDVPPRITVRCNERENMWEFSISDNGIGIDHAFKDKVFVPFQRLHNRLEYSGTGIGLSICKKIVEAHGGTIWFDSAERSGSTFYFTITK